MGGIPVPHRLGRVQERAMPIDLRDVVRSRAVFPGIPARAATTPAGAARPPAARARVGVLF